MARKPFVSLVLVAAFALLLGAALVLIAFPPPLGDAVKRCAAASDACSTLVRMGYMLVGPFLLALLPWSLCHGLASGWWQWRKTHLTLTALRTKGVEGPAQWFSALCGELRLTGRVVLLATDTPLAFCCGLWRPCIWVATSTLDFLSAQEVAAVLRHEQAHLRGKHPLQLLVARSLAAAFPFLPILRELAEVLPLAQELEADRAVIHAGERNALGRALLALVDAPGATTPAALAPGMASAVRHGPNPHIRSAFIDARIDQLTGSYTMPQQLSRRALLLTGMILGAGVLLLKVGALGFPPQRALLALPTVSPSITALPWCHLVLPSILCVVALEGLTTYRRFHSKRSALRSPRKI